MHTEKNIDIESLGKELSGLREKLSEIENLRNQAAIERERLIDESLNGYDVSQAFKILRQALHPDRKEIPDKLKAAAMQAVNDLSRLLRV